MEINATPANALSDNTKVERGFIVPNGDFVTSYPDDGDIIGGGLRIGTNVVAVKFSEVSPAMRDYLTAQGARHLLGDSTANAAKLQKDGDDRTTGEIALELATDKLQSILRGEVSRRGSGGSGLNITLTGSDGKEVSLLNARWVRAITEVVGQGKTPLEVSTTLRTAFTGVTDEKAKAIAAAWRANTAVRTVYDRLTQEANEKAAKRTSGDANSAAAMFASLGLGSAPPVEATEAVEAKEKGKGKKAG